MGVKDILLHWESPARGQAAAEFAMGLARRAHGRITAVGVVLDLAPPGSFIGDYPYEAMNEAMLRSKAELQASFHQRFEEPGLASELRVVQAAPAEARARFARLARCHDLVVMRQPERDASADDELLVEAALFGSGRSVLLVPHAHSKPFQLETATLAWDGGLPAARALAEAIPILRLATRVEVVLVQEAGAPDPTQITDVVRHLALHGIAATGRVLAAGRETGAVLLDHVAETGADCLVMGAYGHSRMREVILGGATREILKAMTTPVLMAH
jgi:nucleotide-binding universal stress UspA family protein